MRRYTQLTHVQRYQIYALKKAGVSQTQIAMVIGVHKSTISRELRRNTGGRGYRPKQADLLAHHRASKRHAARISEATWGTIESLLRQDWSPEQISGRLKRDGEATVSHEWIYQYVLKDKQSGGTLYRHLRCKRKRKKRYGSHERRGRIPDQVRISERPAVVDERSRLGDWELDTIIGAHHKQAIVSLTERKGRFALIAKVERKTADNVNAAVQSLLEPYTDFVHTITSDNGREFAGFKQIAAETHAEYYFADPYASWQRGTNENTNGLIRQYFPKKCDFRTITDEQIQEAMDKLNNRPRKCLGFRTPNEVLLEAQTVALTN